MGKWLVTRDVFEECEIGLAMSCYENPRPDDLYFEGGDCYYY